MAVLFGNVSILTVNAGTSEIILDSESIGDEISKSAWHIPMEDIEAKEGDIIFPASSTEETRMITKTAVKINPTVEFAAIVNADLQFNQLPAGEKFAIAFGLRNVEGMMGEPGNVEIIFENNNDLLISVIAYDSEGNETMIMQPSPYGSLQSTHIEGKLRTDGKIEVIVDGALVCKEALPVSGAGRIGFLQTGSCAATIHNVKVVSYKYDTPENCDIDEDFESGTINKNLLTSLLVYQSYTYFPTSVSIEEMDGNKVMRFQNTGASYLGTTHQYSNFEISFDVPYFARTNELDENNNVVRLKSTAFGVAFGSEAADYNTYGYTTSADMIIFRENSAVESMNLGHRVIDPVYSYADPSNNKPFSVKITMIDSVVTVYLKWMEEADFTEVMSYSFGTETPTGYIQIWTTGLCNFAVDNLKVKNLDINPNLVEVAYTSGAIEKPADFNYQPMEKVYMDAQNEQTNNARFDYFYIPLAVGAVCILAVAAVFVSKKIKTKK